MERLEPVTATTHKYRATGTGWVRTATGQARRCGAQVDGVECGRAKTDPIHADPVFACLFDDGGTYCYTHDTYDDHPLVVVPGVPSIPGGAS